MSSAIRLRKNFFGTIVSVESESAELINRLEKDFAGFPDPAPDSVCGLRLTAELKSRPAEMSQDNAGYRRSKNCEFHDQGPVRWNDYRGEAWVRYDFSTQEARIASESLHRLHEISYLVILSRVGKALDRGGLHRIHAMALASDGCALLLSMPMRGGKTTGFLRLLHLDAGLKMLSDDSPIVDQSGSIISFPLRIGLDPANAEAHSRFEWINWRRTYELDRMRYGRKCLVPIAAIDRGVFSAKANSVILVKGIRIVGRQSRLRRAGILTLLPMVLRNMVIGEGLPMMREYFLEDRRGDFRVCAGILWSRLRAARALLLNSEKFVLFMGEDHETNARMLHQLMTKGGGEGDQCRE